MLNNIVSSIKSPEILQVKMENAEISHGISQEWLPDKWKRMSGCGPCACANILFYLSRRSEDLNNLCPFVNKTQKVILQSESVNFVLDIWNHLYPGSMGVNTVEMFTQGAQSYIGSRGKKLEVSGVHVPGKCYRKFGFEHYVDYLEKGLNCDCPVAFLNLSNGDETKLDSWHWVTVISMERSSDYSQVKVNIVDDTKIKNIDFKKWYDTTLLGGALAYFEE